MWIDGARIGEISVGDLAGLGDHAGIIAVVAENREELSTQIAGVRRVVRSGQAEFRVLRCEGAAKPGRERVFFFGSCRDLCGNRV